MVQIRKKSGLVQPFEGGKIISAIKKSADRVGVDMPSIKNNKVVELVLEKVKDLEVIDVKDLHNIVEIALDEVDTRVAKSYRDYRNYKMEFVKMLDEVYRKKLELSDIRDNSNANADSSLVTTQKALTYNSLNSELYKKFFLTDEEEKAMSEGYIYIHDRGARLDTHNCFTRFTRFITLEGVKSFHDFNEGDKIIVLSHKGIFRKATVIKRPNSSIHRVIFVRGDQKVAVDCTYNHRWLLKGGSETTNIKIGDVLIDTPDMKPTTSIVNNWKVIDIFPIDYTDDVWCLNVEEDHSFMLEFGMPTGNCMLFDLKTVLKGGFRMGNITYREPKTVGTAITLMTDLLLNAGASQYGGITCSEIDKVLAPYAEFSYNRYYNEYLSIKGSVYTEEASKYADEKLRKEIEDGAVEVECRLNSTTTARGDYPFTSISFGLSDSRFGQIITSVFLRVRRLGLGTKEGIPVLFPKLTFMYDENVHGEGKPLEWLFLEAVDCSMRALYPDFLSMSGDGYAPSIYKKYGVTISRMGCRANLSPWYERGGMEPADEQDRPVYEGRFNCGAISLHFPMIVAKAKEENKDFFEVLEYYLQLVRKIHIRTLDFLSHKKAGIDPLAYCEGGAYKGNKDPNEELGRDFLKPCTVSFGITALNEATVMYNGKTIYEDHSEFAEKVLRYVNDFANKYKKIDNVLYAIYSTPAESLCYLQVKQFRKKYGIVNGVSDREYMTNSFHMHVSENITPIEKQDAEYACFHLSNGGNIMYNRFNTDYNKEAFVTLIRRAMAKGYYYGCNLSKNYCDHCGAEFIDTEECPKCGSHDIIQIDRICGYIGYTKIKDYSMMNDGKVAEIKDRKCM